MKLNRTPNPLDRSARNGENDNWEKIEGSIKRIDDTVSDLVLESGGDSNLEVVQARGGKPVLNDRLNNIDAQLAETATKGELHSNLVKKRDKATPITLNDVSPELLAAIEGGEGTSFEIESIPRDKSVTSAKLDIPYNGLAKTFEFELGGVSTSNGELNDSGTSSRTGLVFLKKGSIVRVDSNETEFYILQFDEDNNFIRMISGYTKETRRLEEDMYVKIVQSYSPRKTIYEHDLGFLSNNVYVIDDSVFSTKKELKDMTSALSGVKYYDSVRIDTVIGELALKVEGIEVKKGTATSEFINESEFSDGDLIYVVVKTDDLSGVYERDIRARQNVNTHFTHSRYINDGMYIIVHEFVAGVDYDQTAQKGVNFLFDNRRGNKDLFIHDVEISINGLYNESITKLIDDAIKRENLAGEISRLEGIINGLEYYDAPKEIKILSLGNSFSLDSFEYLLNMARSAGIDATFGILVGEGATLEGHWDAVSSGGTQAYIKWTNRKRPIEQKTFQEVLEDEDWDVITFQNRSSLSGIYAEWQPYLNDLIEYAKQHSNNPNLKIGLHMTWAYATDSTHSGFGNYENDQKVMYDAIINAHLEAFNDADIDLLIPTGTAIQNARTNEYLNGVGRELTRDGYHLDLGVGRFIAGMTWFETLLAGKYSKDLFADMSYSPDVEGIDRFLIHLGKIAVKNAVINPYKITDI